MSETAKTYVAATVGWVLGFAGPLLLVPVAVLALMALRIGGILFLPVAPVLAVAIARARATRSIPMRAAG